MAPVGQRLDGQPHLGRPRAAADGTWVEWSAIRQSEPQEEASTYQAQPDSVQGEVMYPFVAYGNVERPAQRTVWFEGATVWTCRSNGKLEQADVVIHNGKILAVGEALDEASVFGSNVPTYQRIDARGKHLTPGIIDEHTHIAAHAASTKARRPAAPR